MRLYSEGTLSDFLKAMDTEIQKGDVNHEIMSLDNYMTQIEKQNLYSYLRGDVIGLHQGILKFRDQILELQEIDKA